jgi:hypothetical protein
MLSPGLLTRERPSRTEEAIMYKQIRQKVNHWPTKTGLKSVEMNKKSLKFRI